MQPSSPKDLQEYSLKLVENLPLLTSLSSAALLCICVLQPFTLTQTLISASPAQSNSKDCWDTVCALSQETVLWWKANVVVGVTTGLAHTSGFTAGGQLAQSSSREEDMSDIRYQLLGHGYKQKF